MRDFRHFLGVMRAKFGPLSFLTFAMMSSFFLIALSGCRKEAAVEPKAAAEKQAIDPATTNRLCDAAYLGALKAAATNQVAVVGARNLVLRQIKMREEAIRKGLPAEAAAEQVRAAYAKDAEWQRLNTLRLSRNDELKAIALKNKDLIANRLRAEQEANKNLKKQK